MKVANVFISKNCISVCAVLALYCPLFGASALAQPNTSSIQFSQSNSNCLEIQPKIDEDLSTSDSIEVAPSIMLQPHGQVKTSKLKLAQKDPLMDKDSPLYKRLKEQVTPPSEDYFTPLAKEMAQLVGVEEQIKQLQVFNIQASDKSLTEDQRLKVEHNLDHVSAQVYKKILKTNLEVDFVLSEITFELSLDDYLLSSLNNKVQRNLLWANRLDAITNGVLWSLSSALGLRGSNIVPSASTGIVAGAVPSTLELTALQIPVRKRINKTASTNMLAFIFELPSSKNFYFPRNVKKYLKSVPPSNDNVFSRREQLIATWHATGSLPSAKSRGYKKWIRVVTGTYDNSVQTLSKNALEQRMRMLSQLKVTIFSMKRGLFELTNVI